MPWDLEKKVYYVYFVYLLCVTGIFFCFYNIKDLKFSLAFGFLIGSSFSHLAYEVKNALSLKIVKSHSKKAAFGKYFLSYLFNLALGACLIVAIFKINEFTNSTYSYDYLLRVSIYPINIFAFCFGVLTFFISIFIANFLNNKIGKKKEETSGQNNQILW